LFTFSTSCSSRSLNCWTPSCSSCNFSFLNFLIIRLFLILVFWSILWIWWFIFFNLARFVLIDLWFVNIWFFWLGSLRFSMRDLTLDNRNRLGHFLFTILVYFFYILLRFWFIRHLVLFILVRTFLIILIGISFFSIIVIIIIRRWCINIVIILVTIIWIFFNLSFFLINNLLNRLRLWFGVDGGLKVFLLTNLYFLILCILLILSRLLSVFVLHTL
jgi:hypothetical protein